MKKNLYLLIILAAACSAAASPAYTIDGNDDGRPDQWYEISGDKITKMNLDQNFDGQIDYTAEYDSMMRKRFEQLDHNYDGRMDDYYFFEEGRLSRQEVDSNFDGRIDIWVFLYKGIYIQRYEMDKDFDGQVDIKKIYLPE